MATCYKTFVTPTFKKIELPYLKGTQKQIAYGNAIRDKYTDIFIRKVQNGYNPLKGNEEINKLIDSFQAYVNHPKMTESYMWIENHCPKCGCYLNKVEETSYCTNEYCGFKKANGFYVNNN